MAVGGSLVFCFAVLEPGQITVNDGSLSLKENPEEKSPASILNWGELNNATEK